ncbi:Protein MAIN-LIKE 2 [Glycine max]|nr:Protein MAIN-LIKE 2 [Glycine max]
MSSTWEKVVVRDRIWSRVIKKIDKGLLSALLERWHRDKITFHLFVGEMRITLDDMASLLAFFTIEVAIPVLVDLLGVEYKDAFNETKKTRGENCFSMTLKDVASIHWGGGATGLAYLYEHLGCASFAGIKQIEGYATLL